MSDGYEGLERPGMVNYYYGDVFGGDKIAGDKAGGNVLKDIDISGVSGGAVSIGDEGRASVGE